MAVTQKVEPIFSSFNPKISKYLDPRIIYFNSVEVFGPPGTKVSGIFGPFEIFIPLLNLHSTRFVKGDNLFHLKYLILQL